LVLFIVVSFINIKTNNLNLAAIRVIHTSLKFIPCVNWSDPLMVAVYIGLFLLHMIPEF
jgi:hypothetical protein